MTFCRSRRNGCLFLMACLALGLSSFVPRAAAQSRVDENLFGAMRWRQVGPFRGGRVLAVTGVPGEPNVFYFGAASGGAWKSTDAGANWAPLFDRQPIASIGSIAVSPSNHNIIYA